MVGGAIAHPTDTPEPPLITTPLDTIYPHHLRAIIIGCSLRKIGLFSSVTTCLGLDGSLPNRSIQQAQSPSDFVTLNPVCHNIQAANTPYCGKPRRVSPGPFLFMNLPPAFPPTQ